MKVKMLRSLTPGRRGEVVDVDESLGKGLIKSGFAVPGTAAKGRKEGAGKGAGRPTKKAAQNGGQPGKGKRSSSSPEGQASPDSTSSKSKGDAAS